MRIRKALATLVIATLALTGCKKSEPEPMPTVLRPVFTSSTAQVCVDTAFLIRYEDHWCEQGEEGYAWRYITDRADQSPVIAGVGERVTQRGTSGSPPKQGTIGKVPFEGAVFPRSPRPVKS